MRSKYQKADSPLSAPVPAPIQSFRSLKSNSSQEFLAS